MNPIILLPRSSEKAYASAQNSNIYVFTVPRAATKQSIADAVSELYNVTVSTVNVVNSKGKPVRANRGKRAYPGRAYRSTTKKAYVRLAEGSTIALFDEEKK